MSQPVLRVEYPAIFRAADDASNRAQASLLLAYRVNSDLLVLAAIAALFGGTRTLAIGSAVLFLASLGAHILSEFQNLQKRWYQARALAESVKTSTWRFMMGAEPFSGNSTDFAQFRALLSELLVQNEGIGGDLSGDWASHDQITAAMSEAHSAPFEAKRVLYLSERIDEQRDWYGRKARENQNSSKRYFRMTCVAYGAAVLLLLVRIASPATEWLPIEALAVVASSTIGWKQLRRFNDLSSAYSLTAHEVGIIRSRYTDVLDAKSLSEFVSDSENAFSREHTQWAARRDHVR